MLEFRNNLKKIIKFWGIVYLVLIAVEMLFSLFITIIASSGVRNGSISFGTLLNDTYTGTLDIIFKSSIVLLSFVISHLVLFIVFKIINNSKTLMYQKSVGSNDLEYLREVPSNYSPAIVSLILDKKIEPHKDYIATILNLSLKKYIKIENYNGKIIYKECGEMANLNKHERYVYNTLFRKSFFEKNIFNKLVIEDAADIGLIESANTGLFSRETVENMKSFIYIPIVLGFMAIIELLDYLNKIITNLPAFTSTIIISIYIILSFILLGNVYGNKFNLTEKGKEDFKNWIKFKNFLGDFTLTSEKNVQDIILYDKYLVYAISLDRAKNIEKIYLDKQIYKEYESLTNLV